jgi:hypothetical protein
MSEGGEARYAMCNRLVRVIHLWFMLFIIYDDPRRINKMRENCLDQFDTHWNCLELNNQVQSCIRVSLTQFSYTPHLTGIFCVQKT